MKTVLIILAGGEPDKGGVERVTEYMHRELSHLEPDLRFETFHSRVGRGGLALHISVLPALVRFVHKLWIHDIRLVHLNVAPRGSVYRKLLFQLIAKVMSKKVVLQLHGSGFDEFLAKQNTISRRIVKAMFQGADSVIVLSPYWREFAVQKLSIPPRRVIEVSNGVPEPVHTASPPSSPPRIIFTGAVGLRKGVDILIDALARLKRDGLPFECHILGDGDLDRFRDQARDQGVDNQIAFLGWQSASEVGSAMSQASIFTLPSRAENQPVAILEAMANGLPVVSTRIGAIPEQVLEGETGFLVPPEDPEALYIALRNLVLSPQLRIAMGDSGRQRWSKHFSIRANAIKMLQAYRTLIQDVRV